MFATKVVPRPLDNPFADVTTSDNTDESISHITYMTKKVNSEGVPHSFDNSSASVTTTYWQYR